MKDFFSSPKRGWFFLGFSSALAAALSSVYHPLHPRVLAVIWGVLWTAGAGWFLESRNRQDNLFWPCLFASFGLFAIAVANMASVGFAELPSAVALISGYYACRNLALSSVDRSQRPLMLYRAGFALVFLCAAISDLL